MIGFGCDGANVMIGKKGGVSAFLMQFQPSLITVHCFAHRLELAYKDAVKGSRLCDSCTVVLMGLYYFYHNSSKQRQNLKRSFQNLNQTSVMPTCVGGTRWVGHTTPEFFFFAEETGRVKNYLGECNLRVTRQVGECSEILVSNPV